MSESLEAADFVISPPDSTTPIGLALTRAAFARARQQRIQSITADPTALQHLAIIAREPEVVPPLPPTFFVVRDTGGRQLITHWDERLPRYTSDPQPGVFVSPTELCHGQEVQHGVNRQYLCRVAAEIGATTLTEVSLQGWQYTDLPTHAGAVMSAFVSGERPFEPQAFSALQRLGRELITPFRKPGRAANKFAAFGRNSSSYPPPFVVTRVS